MKIRTVALAPLCLAALAACGSDSASATVPQLGASSAGSADATGQGNASRAAALHAAAQCIRQHGVPTYQDPVLGANGQVYTDLRSLQDADRNSPGRSTPVQDAVMRACGTLITAAGFNPGDEAPAPPALVQAGVKAAQCMRANGLPNYRDPTGATPFTPGHGFGITADELPNNGQLGKSDPAFQRATTACRTLLDAEIQASTLTSLSHD